MISRLGFRAIARSKCSLLRLENFQSKTFHRCISNSTFLGSTPSGPGSLEQHVEPKTTGHLNLTSKQKKFLDRALRVNHAGELAATLIYSAQIPPIVRKHPDLKQLMNHMYDQEAGHFTKFNQLLAKHRVRPTAMYPVWQAAATVLGYGTALMGREAAMACTEAVETEIGEHYNSQLRVMLQWAQELEARGEDVDVAVADLIHTIRQIRDEELEHLDHAVEHDAKQAQPYELLTNVIRAGCRTAIWISERV